MYKILLLLIIALPLFSQKLWEIEVDPNDYLRDVVEIPNSDLLLFTYNTGKLEIRNSQDGSFVNRLISKPNESGELRISSNGQLYHYQHHADTIEFRDILTNEAIFRISPEIEGLDSDPKFDSKYFARFEIFDNNSRIVGTISYLDDDDARNSTYRFVIYNLNTREFEHIDKPYHGKYEAIKKTYKSPDDKYFIEFALYSDIVRMFNIETKEYQYEFDVRNEENYYIFHSLLYGKIEQNFISFLDPLLFIRFKFPEFIVLNNRNIFSKHGFYLVGNSNQYNLCNNILTCMISERIEPNQQKFYKYFIKYNLDLEEVIYSSKFFQKSLDYCNIFPLSNCNKIIIDKDYDFRAGIIACYDYNTLDIETHQNNNNYFSKANTNINFNSQEFIGQNARIEIFNSVGAIVGTFYNGIINQPNYSFQIPELTSGTYYLQCQLPNQNLNFNFVVVR